MEGNRKRKLLRTKARKRKKKEIEKMTKGEEYEIE